MSLSTEPRQPEGLLGHRSHLCWNSKTSASSRLPAGSLRENPLTQWRRDQGVVANQKDVCGAPFQNRIAFSKPENLPRPRGQGRPLAKIRGTRFTADRLAASASGCVTVSTPSSKGTRQRLAAITTVQAHPHPENSRLVSALE